MTRSLSIVKMQYKTRAKIAKGAKCKGAKCKTCNQQVSDIFVTGIFSDRDSKQKNSGLNSCVKPLTMSYSQLAKKVKNQWQSNVVCIARVHMVDYCLLSNTLCANGILPLTNVKIRTFA